MSAVYISHNMALLSSRAGLSTWWILYQRDNIPRITEVSTLSIRTAWSKFEWWDRLPKPIIFLTMFDWTHSNDFMSVWFNDTDPMPYITVRAIQWFYINELWRQWIVLGSSSPPMLDHGPPTRLYAFVDVQVTRWTGREHSGKNFNRITLLHCFNAQEPIWFINKRNITRDHTHRFTSPKCKSPFLRVIITRVN